MTDGLPGLRLTDARCGGRYVPTVAKDIRKGTLAKNNGTIYQWLMAILRQLHNNPYWHSICKEELDRRNYLGI